MSASTGRDADSFPGVVLVYGTDEEDGYAIRQTVLAAGKSITFRTPWAINPDDEVFLMAFFLDVWPDTTKRGSYKLTVTDSKQCRREISQGWRGPRWRRCAPRWLRSVGRPWHCASDRCCPRCDLPEVPCLNRRASRPFATHGDRPVTSQSDRLKGSQ
jgi:hypothetical protein